MTEQAVWKLGGNEFTGLISVQSMTINDVIGTTNLDDEYIGGLPDGSGFELTAERTGNEEVKQSLILSVGDAVDFEVLFPEGANATGLVVVLAVYDNHLPLHWVYRILNKIPFIVFKPKPDGTFSTHCRLSGDLKWS